MKKLIIAILVNVDTLLQHKVRSNDTMSELRHQLDVLIAMVPNWKTPINCGNSKNDFDVRFLTDLRDVLRYQLNPMSHENFGVTNTMLSMPTKILSENLQQYLMFVRSGITGNGLSTSVAFGVAVHSLLKVASELSIFPDVIDVPNKTTRHRLVESLTQAIDALDKRRTENINAYSHHVDKTLFLYNLDSLERVYKQSGIVDGNLDVERMYDDIARLTVNSTSRHAVLLGNLVGGELINPHGMIALINQLRVQNQLTEYETILHHRIRELEEESMEDFLAK